MLPSGWIFCRHFNDDYLVESEIYVVQRCGGGRHCPPDSCVLLTSQKMYCYSDCVSGLSPFVERRPDGRELVLATPLLVLVVCGLKSRSSHQRRRRNDIFDYVTATLNDSYFDGSAWDFFGRAIFVYRPRNCGPVSVSDGK